MINERITAKDVEAYKRAFLDQSVLVKVSEASKVLAVSSRTVYGLVESGKLTGYHENPGKPGLRLLASELRDYVQSLKVDLDAWRE